MDRYLSAREVEGIFGLTGATEDVHFPFAEGLLEGTRPWETGEAPEPAVVVGDDSEGCTDADPDQDGAKFGWSAMEVAGWLRDHGYLDSSQTRRDLASRFFDLGLVREAHNLSRAATEAGKYDPRALLLPGFSEED